MDTMYGKYKERVIEMIGRSKAGLQVDEERVYQEANPALLPYIDGIIEENLEPESRIEGFAHLESLLTKAKSGESCLLLMEHYSNFDLPAFMYLLRKLGASGKEIADAVVAIAGIKLSETNPVVTAFTEAYTRIVIYPSRSLEIIKNNLKDPKEMIGEMMKGSAINRAAMKALGEKKKQGKLVLVFPSGTRFRPWDPSTKKGVREIDSYIKTFDWMCCVSINGNILRLNPNGDMTQDIICRDVIVYDAGEPKRCEDFREHVKKHSWHDDKKQAVADAIMDELERMHVAMNAKLGRDD
jgi:glycerol-3-phosphate O-acyltransferase